MRVDVRRGGIRLEGGRAQRGGLVDSQRSRVDDPVLLGRDGSVHRVSYEGAGGLGRDLHLEGLIVKTPVDAEPGVGHHQRFRGPGGGVRLERTREAEVSEAIGPVGRSTVGLIGDLRRENDLVDDLAVLSAQEQRFSVPVELEVRVQNRRNPAQFGDEGEVVAAHTLVEHHRGQEILTGLQ